MAYRTKIKTREAIASIAKRLREQDKTVVMTGGVFDILHPGHTRCLGKAKSFGDRLIVAINSDRSTTAIKGPSRPINHQKFRAEVIAALESVDYVTIFDELTPTEIINEVQPDIWVKGGDYKNRDLPEARIIKAYGGKIRIVPGKIYSVTEMINKICRK